MSAKDNITLPREVGEYLMGVLEEFESPHHGDWSARDVVALAALRTALAAPKQEPSGLRKAAEAVLERWDSPAWEWKKQGPTADLMADLRTALAAPTVKESLTHPGYVIGSHWLETAYSRICAGEAEEEVLRDCGWERVDEALRRDAERYRWLRNRACHGPHERFVAEYGWFDVSGQHEPGFDAAIDAAMGDKT